MKFPLNVQKSAARAGKVTGGDKVKLSLLLGIALFAGINLFTIPFFSSMGIPWYIPFSIIGILYGMIFVLVFRFAVFKENDKLAEYEGFSSDSFAKYYGIRNIDSGETLENKVPIFEFGNGTHVVGLVLRYGSNDDSKAVQTRMALEEIYNIIGKQNLDFSYICSTEDFSKSKEYAEYMRKSRKIKDMKLAKPVIDMAQMAVNIAEESSNVETSTILIRTRSNYQKYELESVLKSIMKVLTDLRTCFRSVEFLSKNSYLELIEDFYELEAIDLSLMRLRGSEELDKDYQSLIQVYQLTAKTGKKLINSEVLEKAVSTPRKIN